MADEPETPWKRATKKRYQLQEERTARKKDAKKQPNSGRGKFLKGDVSLASFIGRLLIDNKTTENDSYRLDRPDWLKFRRMANKQPPGCQPVLQVDIRDLRLIVVEEGTWDEALERIALLEARLGLDD